MNELHLNDNNGDIDKMLEELREKSEKEKYNESIINIITPKTKKKVSVSPTSKQCIYRYLTVAVMFIALTTAVLWLFVDIFHIKAVYVSLIWVPITFAVQFFIEKVWVFEK